MNSAAARSLALVRWFDTWAGDDHVDAETGKRFDLVRVLPFIVMHVACLGVFLVGWSPVAVAAAVFLYAARMFFVTGFFHRYFSHRTFRTTRFMQFLFALAGATAVQRGALWWAAHHRHHHRHADGPGDPHSPARDGLYWSHMGWITSRENFRTRVALVPDLAKYPELCFLDRFDMLVPVLFAGGLYGLGALLGSVAPALGTSGPQMLVWAFFISTVVLFHATCTINSLAHLIGTRRYEVRDDSRNHWGLALLTLGEGWHNNHHRFPGTVRQGFAWWELDPTWWGLLAMEKLGLVSHLHPVPAHILEEGHLR